MCSSKPRMLFQIARLCGIPLIFCATAGNAAGQCYYTWEEIVPPPGGEFITPMALNNLGHVAGFVEYGGTDRAFVWSPEQGTRLLPVPAGVSRMQATGNNDLGHVCGWMDGPGEVVSFLWDGEHYTLIHSPYPQTRIEANDVNNLDQVVGTIVGAPGGNTGFLWGSGSMMLLTEIIGSPHTHVVAINDRSDIVGTLRYRPNRAFILDSTVHWLPLANMDETLANGLNDEGQVVGYGYRESDPNLPYPPALIWDGPAVYRLDAPSGYHLTNCLRINNAGRAIGFYDIDGSRRAFVWQNGVARLLQEFVGDFVISLPADINQYGQIACHSSSPLKNPLPAA